MQFDFTAVLQTLLTILSIPVVAAALSWASRRLTKEGRLGARVERLSVVYPNLPEGDAKNEYAERINEALSELNARLDPVFKLERKRKRTVGFWVYGIALLLTFIFIPGFRNPEQANAVAGWTSVVGGLVLAGAFWLIEKDTKRQRAALQRSKDDGGPSTQN
jgi:hypothetical protein